MQSLAGQSPKDHTALRSLSALVASLPASEHHEFREEFDQVSIIARILCPQIDDAIVTQEYEDVQLTSYLFSLTKTANAMNDVSQGSFDIAYILV